MVHKIGQDASKYFAIRIYEPSKAETEMTFSLSLYVAY
jgi:hypothetical protein